MKRSEVRNEESGNCDARNCGVILHKIDIKTENFEKMSKD